MNRCSQFRKWLRLTRKFRRIAVDIAGSPGYQNNRHAIKHHIRRRTSDVLDGFDVTAQIALFRSDVFHIIQGGK